jgi:hypothetical protein
VSEPDPSVVEVEGDPLTDDTALERAQAQFALTGEQARLLAAKEGLVRAVAEESERPIVLKGGTLLAHAYGSPRVSIADADYADAGRDGQGPLDAAAVQSLVDIDRSETQAFKIEARKGTWGQRDDMIEGTNVPFALTNVEPESGGSLAISVSVRRAEVLGGVQPVDFQAIAIRSDRAAQVHGLTLEEASVEKIIAWCLKGKPKHFVDLAFIARDYPKIAAGGAEIRAMLVEKVDLERLSGATAAQYVGIEDARALLGRLDRERRLNG